MRPVLGLVGHKRSGKDTFAAYLVEHYGFVRVAFADPLKQILAQVDPILSITTGRVSDVLSIGGWEGVKDYQEGRRLLQALGVAVRQVNENFWLNAALRIIDSSDRPIVVTDVRFPNEAEAIQKRGVLLRITRPGAETGDKHISETALDNWECDEHVINDGTIAELQHMADEVGRAAVGRPATDKDNRHTPVVYPDDRNKKEWQ